MTSQSRRRPLPDSALVVAEPFFIGNRRAMVSLGPMTPATYCTYRCQFCYVNGPFPRYDSRPVDQIVSWLEARRPEYDIVYVSGDTDSFAPPRTSVAFQLLEALLVLEADVLFTTRYVFSHDERARLTEIWSHYRARNLRLIPCVSVSQLAHPDLEPHPIPPPLARVEQLAWLTSLGLPALLTIRPFIPTVPASEYVEIAQHGLDSCVAVLGGDLYLDQDGALSEMISHATRPLSGVLEESRALDFTHSDDAWRIVKHPAAVGAVSRFCAENGLPFFMRSGPAVDYLRSVSRTID